MFFLNRMQIKINYILNIYKLFQGTKRKEQIPC